MSPGGLAPPMGRPLAWLFVILILLWVTTLGILYYSVAIGGFLSCCRLPPVTASGPPER